MISGGINRPALSQREAEPIEMEGFVSCTSDGLVVVLRRGRVIIPTILGGQIRSVTLGNSLSSSYILPIIGT